MLLKIGKSSDVKASEITPEEVFLDRRRFMGAAALGALGSLLPETKARAGETLGEIAKSSYAVEGGPTSRELITSYNNFYEFGAGKEEPAANAANFNPRSWSVAIEGAVGKPGSYAYEDLIKPHKLEERVYRLRCVEAWSMVVPWVGIPLGDVLKRFDPTSQAKYVAFETLHDAERMPGQRRQVLPWPYVEGLRMDEALHPLTILAVGLYGKELPNQNGAPVRLVAPWKYGFKSIKSIVAIRLVETMPATTWNRQSPREYGFYANVNPTVDHPRWSQEKERVIGDSFLAPKKKTLMFNGYADEVAGLYAGMDLKKHF